MRRTKTTVTACRLPDDHFAALKAMAAMRNLPVGSFLRVMVREFLERRLIIHMP